MGLKEREGNINKMLSSLPKETEVIRDEDYNSCHTLQRVVDSDESILIMEDDIELCKNFYQKALKEIEKTPDEVVMFYATKKWEEKCMEDIEQANWLPFVYTQAFYLPPKLGKELRVFLMTNKEANRHRYSLGINKFLVKKWVKKRVILPTLVQHIWFQSIWEPNKPWIMHQSKTYVYDDEEVTEKPIYPDKKEKMKLNYNPKKESYVEFLKKKLWVKKKKTSKKEEK